MKRLPVCLSALVLAGCGAGGAAAPHATRTPAAGGAAAPHATRTPAAGAAAAARPSATPIPLSVSDHQLCTVLYARLQRVTLALGSSSELIAHSRNPQDLSERIATEQQQLERSARLMAAGTVPGRLSAVNARLVRALRAFSRDFARARAPAARGDFPAAVAAMTDKRAVGRILAAATAIQRACQP